MNKGLATISIILFAVVTGSMAATPMQTTQDAVDGNWLVINGQKKFFQGMNIAWITNNSFGNDVGDSKININAFTSHIKNIRKVGGNAVRWWLHTDASHCPKIDASGAVTGIGSKTIANMQEALDTAYAYGVVVSMCLFSFDLLDPGQPTSSNPKGKASYSDYSLEKNQKFLTVPGNIDTYLQKGLKPILEAVGNHPAIMSWEVFNEPEGMINGHGWTSSKVDASHVQRITNKIAGFVHENSKKLVSTGAHCADDVAYYKDAALKAAGGVENGTLDFLQIHYYPEWFDATHSPVHNPKSYWNTKWENKPVMIGEFPAKSWSTSIIGTSSKQPLKTSKTIEDAYKYAYENGYAGAMSWTMVTDAAQAAYFGSYETTVPALQALFNAHKNDILIKDATIQEMSGNYAMKLDLKNLPIPTGGGAYNELGTSFSKNFTGKTNLYFDLFVTAGSGANATIVPVIKVGSSYTWSPAQKEALNLASIEKGKWVTYSIPVTAFGAGDVSDVKELLFQYWATETPYTGTFYFDNVRVDNDTLSKFNTEESVWGTGADAASVSLVKFSDVTSIRSNASVSRALHTGTTVISQGKSIQFNLSERSTTRVELIDLTGSVVASVTCGEMDAGIHTVDFVNVPSGHYICTVYQNAARVSAQVVLH